MLIKARVVKGSFKPLKKIDIAEGKEVILSVKESKDARSVRDVLRSTAGSWKDLVDTDKMKEDIYKDRLSTRPHAEL